MGAHQGVDIEMGHPKARRLGSRDGGAPGLPHAAFAFQPRRPIAVGLSPGVRLARRDQLHGAVRVELASQTIHPATAQQFVQHSRLGKVWRTRVLLESHQPDAAAVRMMRFQPAPQVLG